MKKKLLMILILLFVMIGDFRLSWTSKSSSHYVEWNGIVWCMLDWWSISHYHSQDSPKLPLMFE